MSLPGLHGVGHGFRQPLHRFAILGRKEVGRAEKVFLQGPSGSGKSTLLAGAFPAWRAYRMSLADGLTMRL